MHIDYIDGAVKLTLFPPDRVLRPGSVAAIMNTLVPTTRRVWLAAMATTESNFRKCRSCYGSTIVRLPSLLVPSPAFRDRFPGLKPSQRIPVSINSIGCSGSDMRVIIQLEGSGIGDTKLYFTNDPNWELLG